jgi:hypothetical protein
VTHTAWTAEQLERIGAADELGLAARRPDGTLRMPVTIWVVRIGDDLYVRSWRGDDGAWFRAAKARLEGHVSAGGVEQDVAFVGAYGNDINDQVDAGYREKYRRYPSYVEPMVTPQARSTTLRLVPQQEAHR